MFSTHVFINSLYLHFSKNLYIKYFTIFTVNLKQKVKILWEKNFSVNDSKII